MNRMAIISALMVVLAFAPAPRQEPPKPTMEPLTTKQLADWLTPATITQPPPKPMHTRYTICPTAGPCWEVGGG